MDLVQLQSKLTHHPRSPLFARLAHEYLDVGKTEQAKDVCRGGIENYPSYTTAHLVLARCFESEKDYLSALLHLHQALHNNPDAPTLKALRTQWENLALHQLRNNESSVASLPHGDETSHDVDVAIERQTPVAETTTLPEETMERKVTSEITVETGPEVDETMDVVVPSEHFEDSAHDSKVVEENIETTPSSELKISSGENFEETSSETEEVPEDVLENLTTMAAASTPVESETITIPESTITPPVKIQPTYEVPYDLSEENRIVSKTLAEIYASQGAYGEAILTYQLLKRLKPENSTECDQRIQELQLKLQSKLLQSDTK